MGDELFAGLQAALAALGPLELQPLMAQALHMGDELHNRNAAATALLLKRLAARAAGRTRADAADAARASLEFLAGNDHFFLNLSMAACKAHARRRRRRARQHAWCTAMARNGVDFGIRLSGTGDRWFTAPAPRSTACSSPATAAADAARGPRRQRHHRDRRASAGSPWPPRPAIVQFVGGTPADATANSRRMLRITLGSNPAFTLPALNFGGTPAGIDARLVLDSGILPIINTGIAHKEAGVGQIGAGITTAPLECFIERSPRWRPHAGRCRHEPAWPWWRSAATPSCRARRRTRSPTSTRRSRRSRPHLVDLVSEGWRLVVTHGNGPQVGFILRRSELAPARSTRCRSTTPLATPREPSATCS